MLQRILVPVRKRLVRAFPSKSTRRHGMVGPAHVWKMKRAFQIRFLTDQGLKPEHYFLDLGCGTLRGGIPLIEYLEPGHYFGLEINADRLAEGRKEVRELGLEEKRPTLVQHIGDIDRKFDYVWAFSVLIHMTDEVLDETLGFVGNHLSGAFYANVNIGERHQSRWAEFPVVWRSFDFYRDACASHGLTVADLVRSACSDTLPSVRFQNNSGCCGLLLQLPPIDKDILPAFVQAEDDPDRRQQSGDLRHPPEQRGN